MAHPTIPVSCPHCGRRPGIHAVLTAIIQTLRAMAFDQVLTGWRWLAFCSAIAGLLLVQHGAQRFTWGAGANLVAEGDVRQRYLDALRAADGQDYARLLAFVRS